ncbi:uncharacterized protein [Antedon mediterranea]|uniref:uncharacterized protein n=1 Tax=Antedon mediterranea TaxID=105859 RepID=UPI003AF697E0
MILDFICNACNKPFKPIQLLNEHRTGSLLDNDVDDAELRNDSIVYPAFGILCKLCEIDCTKGFKIGHLNVRSLYNKVDHVRSLLSECRFHVLGISETWLDQNIHNSELAIPGYLLVRTDRNRHGGGVAIYVNENVDFDVIDFGENTIESVWIKIKPVNTKPFVIGNVYRPPNSCTGFVDIMHDQISFILDSIREIIVVGDLNWNIFDKQHSRNIKTLHQIFQLNQYIKTPTRVTENSSSCIDLIFSNRDDFISKTGVVPIGISDHSLIYAIRKKFKIKLPPRILHTRTFRKFNEDLFISDLASAPWSICEASEDADEAWDIWKHIFTDICDIHAPMVTVRRKGTDIPWLTDEFVSLSRDRDYLKQKAEKTNNIDDWNSYKKARNKLNNLSKSLKRDYINNKLKDNVNDTKTLWKTMKDFLPNKKKQTKTTLNVNGNEINNPTDIANHFNKYFCSISNELASHFNDNQNDITVESLSQFQQRFNFKDINGNEIEALLEKLEIGKATGIDGISARLLKIASSQISQSLAFLFNWSLRSGVIPSEWKCAKVTPLYKGGFLYADDTALFYACKSNEELTTVLTEQLENVKQWLDKHKLTLNIDKTKYMLFGTHARVNKTTDETIEKFYIS